ncbi:hypothetical protein ACA910_002688 [Epithemia clementina (nom. ined.)]
MCVTNTTYRRQQPISLVPPNSSNPNISGLTQRLLGTFQLKTAPAKPQEHAVSAFAAPVSFIQTMATAQHQQLAATCGMVSPVVQHSACPTIPKPRPKRRRKPQKPGKTAKMNERHFVVHNYHDHALDQEDFSYEQIEEEDEHGRRKGGVAIAFPLKLHAILDQVEQDGLGHVISWQPHGRCFAIHQPKIFVDSVMPKYFRQTKLTSFQRQLNLYGFCRLTKGPDAGGYYHELFLRGKTFLTKKMIRTKVKGTRFKAASSPDQEPDFYSMPAVVVSPSSSPTSSPQYQSMKSSDDSISEASSLPPVNNILSFLRNAQHQPTYEPTSFQFLPAPQPVYQPTIMASAPALMQSSADLVLDEAVEQLFLNGPIADMGDLNDFVHDWDPNNGVTQSLENDVQLGYMLDRLLAD